MNMNKSGKKKGNLLMRLIYIAMGGAIGVLMARCGVRYDMDFLPLYLLTMGVFLIALVLTTVIHEAGHLVGGLLTGYRFACFRVMGISWSRGTDGKIRMGRISTPGVGGQCLMLPPPLEEGKKPFMLYQAGGSLMNLIFAALFAAGAIIAGMQPPAAAVSVLMSFYREPLSQGRAIAELILWIFAVSNLASALTNGIPMKTHLISNDGQNMLDLRRSPDALRRHWTDMKIAAGIWQGEQLKDMPAEWFSMPSDEQLCENPMFVSAGMMYYSYLMDDARVEEAKQVSERLLSLEEGLSGLHRALLRMDRAFMEMLDDTPLEYVRRENVERWLDKPTRQVMQAMKKSLTALRIEYADALLIQKDEAKAAQIEVRFEKITQKHPVLTDVQSERKLLALIKSIYERREAQQTE